jgi:hypothetical protein
MFAFYILIIIVICALIFGISGVWGHKVYDKVEDIKNIYTNDELNEEKEKKNDEQEI